MRPDGYLLEAICDPAAVVREVARGFRQSEKDITGTTRRTEVTRARACAMAVMRRANMSFPEIGRYFGRDHSTVMTAVEKARTDPDLRRAVDLVVDEMTAKPPRLFAVEAS